MLASFSEPTASWQRASLTGVTGGGGGGRKSVVALTPVAVEARGLLPCRAMASAAVAREEAESRLRMAGANLGILSINMWGKTCVISTLSQNYLAILDDPAEWSLLLIQTQAPAALLSVVDNGREALLDCKKRNRF